MRDSKIIGLIIPNPVLYSETFFASDCQVMSDLGHEVKILTLYNRSKGDIPVNVPYSYPPPSLSKNTFIRFLQILRVFLPLFITSMKQLWKFIQLEFKENVPVKQIITRVYSNSHILRDKKLDILLFGYGNLLIERENLAKALDAQSIMFFRGADLGVYPLINSKDCYLKAFRKLDKAAFRNNHLLKLAKRYHFDPQTPHNFVYNKIELELFTPKSELGEIHKPVRLLAIARLHWRKGLPDLIRALAEFKTSDVSFELTIIGSGEEFEHLFYISRQLDLLNEITFTGKLPYEQVRNEMHEADILINPSLFESNCRVLLEAQATGLLLISSHWEGADEIVLHEKTGWLVPKRAPKAIAAQLGYIVNLPLEKRKEIAGNAVNHIHELFNLKNAQQDFKALLDV